MTPPLPGSEPFPRWGRVVAPGAWLPLIITALTWPLVPEMGTRLVGFPNVDASDTVMGLLSDPRATPAPSHSDAIYFPVGFDVLHLTLNVLDHLTGAVFDWIFPFPWSDNPWWVTVLLLNGLAGHHLGRRLEGRRRRVARGVAWLTAEPLLRETNLHHAPQAMTFWAPMYLAALLQLHEAPDHPRSLRRPPARPRGRPRGAVLLVLRPLPRPRLPAPPAGGLAAGRARAC